MAVKTKIIDSNFKKILTEYSIGDFKEAKPFSAGCVQTNVLLKTSKGKFAFRLYENRSKEYILFELNVLYYLNKHEYPCAMPIRNLHGKLISKFKRKYFAIFEYIDGNHIKKPAALILPEIAKKLAALHNISQGYKPKYFEFRESHEPKFVLKTIREIQTKVKSKQERSRKVKFIKEELIQLKFPGSLPKGVNHCDYDFANIKLKNNMISGILDFDDSCYTYLVFDIGSLVYYWAWIQEKDFKFNFKKAKILIKSYSKKRKMSVIEKKHVFDGLKMQILVYMGWFFASKYKNIDVFEESCKQLQFLNNIGRDEFYKKLFE
jgi:homoserine kinase type II